MLHWPLEPGASLADLRETYPNKAGMRNASQSSLDFSTFPRRPFCILLQTWAEGKAFGYQDAPFSRVPGAALLSEGRTCLPSVGAQAWDIKFCLFGVIPNFDKCDFV